MTKIQSPKRIVVESKLHKAMKLIAISNDIDLQDLVAIALHLFASQSEKQIKRDINDTQN